LTCGPFDVAEIYGMIDSLGDVRHPCGGEADRLTGLYKELNVSAVYRPDERAVDVTARPLWIVRVSEGELVSQNAAHLPSSTLLGVSLPLIRLVV
jgi:hypothetical protein